MFEGKRDRRGYWNKRSKTYMKETEETFGEANRKIVSQIKKFCSPKDVVLDIGCGPGIITKDMAPYVSRIKAIDISPEMIREARKNNLENVEWEVNELTEVDSRENFTLITACNVLLYMENIEAIITEIRKRLPDGGYFIAAIDCLGEKKDWHYFLRVVKIQTGIRPYNRNYTIEEFRELFTGNGFEIVYEENLYKPSNNYLIVGKKKI